MESFGDQPNSIMQRICALMWKSSTFSQLNWSPSWIVELWTRVACLSVLHFLVGEVTFLILWQLVLVDAVH